MKLIIIEDHSEVLLPLVVGLLRQSEDLVPRLSVGDLLRPRAEQLRQGPSGHRGVQEGAVPPVQVNVNLSGGGGGTEDKADVRHAELRQDLHAVKESVDGVGHVVAAIRRESEDLKAMQAAGLFGFVTTVHQDDMRLFLTILQHGDQSKAARALNMNDRTLRDRIKSWASLSRPYRVMHNMILWRKGVSRRERVPFTDTLVEQIRQGNDMEEVLRQVLEGLAEMDSENWPDVRDELEEAIKEVTE